MAKKKKEDEAFDPRSLHIRPPAVEFEEFVLGRIERCDRFGDAGKRQLYAQALELGKKLLALPGLLLEGEPEQGR